MTRQRSPWRWAMGRATVACVALVAMVGLMAAAPASATPEGDADVAITDAWNAAGGVASTLGDKDGGVYAAGPGFVQNFAAGAIYYTPATGARIMHGAILDRYRALGGPDGDLGFPTIDEGPGRVSPESRNSTFSAADNPVIFWTPETGAWVVRGAMNAAWDRLGGSAGALGVPVEDETYAGSVINQRFVNGLISYDTATATFTTEPPELAGELAGLAVPADPATAINLAYRMAGGPDGPLGARDGDAYSIGDEGTAQNFANGKIYYTVDTGAHALTGAILARYESAGGPTGELAFPTSGEVDGGVPDSKQVSFAAPDHPVIFWTEEHGAIVVNGPVKTAWDKLGGPTGALGIPIAEHDINRDVMSQRFSGGEITWNATDRTFTTKPDELAGSLEGIEVPNQPLPNVPAAPPVEQPDSSGWNVSWLWWLVPLLVLVAISGLVWLVGRRRSGAAATAEPTERRQRGQDESDRGDADHGDTDYGDDYGDSHYGDSHYGDSHYGDAHYGDAHYGDDYEEGSGYRAGDVVIHDELFTHRGAHQVETTADLEENQDVINTAPTRYDFVAEGADFDDETPSGRHAAVRYEPAEEQTESVDYAEPLVPPLPDWGDKYGLFNDYQPEALTRPVAQPEPDPEPHGGEESAYPAIHLPLEDPHEAPAGFSIKACMRSGSYHVPGGLSYDETIADIWFADEQHAQANGFHRAD